jgi:glycogen operon protein
LRRRRRHGGSRDQRAAPPATAQFSDHVIYFAGRADAGGGGRIGRTQGGNNNAYCQDNEISWLKWERDEHGARLTKFVSQLTAFRKKHPVFRRLNFFRGKAIRGSKFRDVIWLNSGGKPMTDEEWNSCHRCMGVFLSGHLKGSDGKIINDDFFLVCFNAHHEPVSFSLPVIGAGAKWERLLDTANEEGFLSAPGDVSEKFDVEARSLSILRLKAPESLDRASVMGNL